MRRRIPLWENANPRQKPEDDAAADDDEDLREGATRRRADHRSAIIRHKRCTVSLTKDPPSPSPSLSLSPRPDPVLFSFPSPIPSSSFALIQQCSHAHVNFSCPLGHGRRTTDNAFPSASFLSHSAPLSLSLSLSLSLCSTTNVASTTVRVRPPRYPTPRRTHTQNEPVTVCTLSYAPPPPPRNALKFVPSGARADEQANGVGHMAPIWRRAYRDHSRDQE